MTNNETDLATFDPEVKECEDGVKPPADAQKVVDRLDQILDGKLDVRKKRRYLLSLMKICKAYRLVPASHLIPEDKLEKLDDPLPDEPDVWPGSYGEKPVSIKVFSKYQTDDEKAIKRRLCREAVIWKRTSHPNILPLIGVTLSNELAVVYPWKTNILDYLMDNHDANPVKLLEEGATGLKYLHDGGLVHGGLQGRYILVTDDEDDEDHGHACLANVGHASINRESWGSVIGQAGQGSTLVGDASHFRYFPPEFLKDEPVVGDKPGPRRATKQSDIYSVGMTIYEVLTGEKPFKEHSSYSVVIPIINGTRPKKPNFLITRGYTEELWKLTTDCWKPIPAERPTIDEVLKSLGDAAPLWKARK